MPNTLSKLATTVAAARAARTLAKQGKGKPAPAPAPAPAPQRGKGKGKPAPAPAPQGAATTTGRKRPIEGSNPQGAIAQGMLAQHGSKKITLLCAGNPRMPGRATHARFAVLMAHAGKPVSTYTGNFATLRNAVAQGHVKLT